MKAIILVGGFGTRLRPLTYSRPKPLLPVLDRFLLDWIVDRLVSSVGVDEVVLSLGYLPDAFRVAYPDGCCAGARLTYAVEPSPLDTAGAVRFAALEAGFDRDDEPFFVLNGDVLTDADPGRVLDLHRSRGAEATIALTPVEDPSRFGVVPIEPDGRVTAFIEKPSIEEAPSIWINAGTYVVAPSVIDRIPDGRRVSIEREIFPSLVAAGALYAVQDAAYWVDTGTPEAYIQCQLDLLARRGDTRHVAASAAVDASARVDEAVILDRAVVEEGAEVVRSVVLDGARIGAGARVIDSIVGAGARICARAELSELTIVGDGVAVGEGQRLRGARVPDRAD